MAFPLPPPGVFKLNVDGAFHCHDSTGGVGGVIPYHTGNWIMGFSNSASAFNTAEMDFKVLLLGLQLATLHVCLSLEVETDAMEVRHNFREANKVAHFLAKHGSSMQGDDFVVFLNSPSFVSQEMYADMQELYVSRSLSSSMCSDLAMLGNLCVVNADVLSSLL
ncbi:hypothetical protein BC332_15358 [Capsicum chinense]|nr:hypothetical protein BC332_15358 [Capsicum chinense]